MRRTLLASLLLLPVLGCSDDASVVLDAAAVDAAVIDTSTGFEGDPPDGPGPDAVPSTVVEVPCAGATIASDVTAPGFSYVITQGQILVNDVVRFTMPGIHNAISGPVTGGVPAPDGMFTVDFGATKCLRFTSVGSFDFYCSLHLFTGTLIVLAPAKRAP